MLYSTYDNQNRLLSTKDDLVWKYFGKLKCYVKERIKVHLTTTKSMAQKPMVVSINKSLVCVIREIPRA